MFLIWLSLDVDGGVGTHLRMSGLAQTPVCNVIKAASVDEITYKILLNGINFPRSFLR